jgi:hypothetical protein
MAAHAEPRDPQNHPYCRWGQQRNTKPGREDDKLDLLPGLPDTISKLNIKESVAKKQRDVECSALHPLLLIVCCDQQFISWACSKELDRSKTLVHNMEVDSRMTSSIAHKATDSASQSSKGAVHGKEAIDAPPTSPHC